MTMNDDDFDDEDDGPGIVAFLAVMIAFCGAATLAAWLSISFYQRHW